MEPTDLKAKDQYLQQDRSVNIRSEIEKQQKLKEGGLDGIEIRQTVKSLGKDDFLKLLVTQLTHQDPTKPQTDQEFIAQMAQFSSLEQMQNVSKNLGKLSERQSANLVGKFIVGKDFVTGQEVTGVAAAIFYDGSGEGFVKVRGRTVNLNDISLIGDPHQFKKEYGGYGTTEQGESPTHSANPDAAPVPGPSRAPTRAPENGMPAGPGPESPVPGKEGPVPGTEPLNPGSGPIQQSKPGSNGPEAKSTTEELLRHIPEIPPGSVEAPEAPGKSVENRQISPTDPNASEMNTETGDEVPGQIENRIKPSDEQEVSPSGQSYLNHLYNKNKEESRVVSLAV